MDLNARQIAKELAAGNGDDGDPDVETGEITEGGRSRKKA